MALAKETVIRLLKAMRLLLMALNCAEEVFWCRAVLQNLGCLLDLQTVRTASRDVQACEDVLM